MNGDELAKLMVNSWLKAALAKSARRYSRKVENQEEYIQDAWLRIAEHPAGNDLEYYAEQAEKAMNAARMRNVRNTVSVHKNNSQNVHGNSKKGNAKPRKGIQLERGKYVDCEPESLDSWYYGAEWKKVKDNEGNEKWEYSGGEWEDYVRVVFHDEHVEYFHTNDFEFDGRKHKEHRTCEKSDSNKWRINRIAVTKLSQVKTPEDWEEYESRKAMVTNERLRHESGIGQGAYSLPESHDYTPDNDVF